MNPDQAGSCNHLDVIGAAPTRPGVSHHDKRHTVRLRAPDGFRRGGMHRKHSVVVAAIHQSRGAHVTNDGRRRSARRIPLRDIEEFCETGILITAQRRVNDVIRDDPCFIRVIADAPHSALAKFTRFSDSQAHTVGTEI